MYPYLDDLMKRLETTSQNRLSKAIGINPSALSKYLKQSYDGDLDSLNSKVKTYLELEEQRGDAWDDRIVETETMRQINKVIRLVHKMRKMGVVYGAAGLGKTVSLKRYHEDYPNSVMITGCPDSKSVSGAIRLLYYALKRDHSRKSTRQARIEIVTLLTGSNTLVIVDDAHELTNDALEELRSIHDSTSCPFVFVGTEEIVSRLVDPDARRILAQMSSRLPVKRIFELAPSGDDFKAVCSAYGIKDREVVKHLFSKSKQGGLRLAVNQIKIALNIANGTGVTMKDLIQVEGLTGEFVEN